MSDQLAPSSGKRGTRRAFSCLAPVIVGSLVLYFIMPRVGFEETWRWYIPEMLLLGLNVAVLLIGGVMWLLARLEAKKRKGG